MMPLTWQYNGANNLTIWPMISLTWYYNQKCLTWQYDQWSQSVITFLFVPKVTKVFNYVSMEQPYSSAFCYCTAELLSRGRKKNSNDISSESTHQIHSQKSCILLVRISTKIVQRIVEVQILDFCEIIFVFLNMGLWGVKVSNDISS